MATKPGLCPKCKTSLNRDASTREFVCVNCGHRHPVDAPTRKDLDEAVSKMFSELSKTISGESSDKADDDTQAGDDDTEPS